MINPFTYILLRLDNLDYICKDYIKSLANKSTGYNNTILNVTRNLLCSYPKGNVFLEYSYNHQTVLS